MSAGDFVINSFNALTPDHGGIYESARSYSLSGWRAQQQVLVTASGAAVCRHPRDAPRRDGGGHRIPHESHVRLLLWYWGHHRPRERGAATSWRKRILPSFWPAGRGRMTSQTQQPPRPLRAWQASSAASHSPRSWPRPWQRKPGSCSERSWQASSGPNSAQNSAQSWGQKPLLGSSLFWVLRSAEGSTSGSSRASRTPQRDGIASRLDSKSRRGIFAAHENCTFREVLSVAGCWAVTGRRPAPRPR